MLLFNLLQFDLGAFYCCLSTPVLNTNAKGGSLKNMPFI